MRLYSMHFLTMKNKFLKGVMVSIISFSVSERNHLDNLIELPESHIEKVMFIVINRAQK